MIFFLSLLFFASVCRSQHYFLNNLYYENAFMLEAGAGTGLMNCNTDLGGGKKTKGIGSVNWINSKPVIHFFLSGIYKNKISVRLDLNAGSVAAADSILDPNNSHTRDRYDRHLAFKSAINEMQLLAEIYPVSILTGKQDRLSPFLLTGFGYFNFNPKAEINNHWYYLRPLRTEGQGFAEYPGRKMYKLNQFNFSIGGGCRFELNEMVNLKMEINYRFLNTDYLDDVSTTYISPELFANYLSPNQAQIAGKLYNRRLGNGTGNQMTDLQRGNPARDDSYFSILIKTGILIPQSHR
jgi:hypothetical protein